MLKTLKTAFTLMILGADTPLLKIKLILSALCGILLGVFGFLFPYYLSLMVKAINQQNKTAMLNAFFLMVLCAFFIFLIKYIWRYWLENISETIPIEIKQIYFEKLFHKPYAWHLNNSVGYFSTALERVYTMMHSWLWKAPYDYIAYIVMTMAFLIYTAFISIYLFIYFLTALSLMVILCRFMYEKRLHFLARVAQSRLKFGKFFIDFLYNIRSVKKMNLFSFASTKIRHKGNELCESFIQMMRYNALQWGIMELSLLVIFMAPVIYYVFQYLKYGTGVEVIVLIVSMQPKMEEMGRQLMTIFHDIASTQAEYQILSEHLEEKKAYGNAKESLSETKSKNKMKKKWQKITLKETQFTYIKDGHVFRHCVPDFTIYPGDHIAVTGKSGEGKTTFLNILTNQFPLNGGHICVDHMDYAEVPQSFFDQHMTYISQDVELFDMTLYDNIVMGQKVSDRQIRQIIEGCQLNDLIARMHGNMHTDIGEKGIKVSAGEKQRINLARGLLLNRDILVLDEITANLDPVTTQKIWNFIFTQYADKTIIAVSHENTLLNHVSRRLHFSDGCGRPFFK